MPDISPIHLLFDIRTPLRHELMKSHIAACGKSDEILILRQVDITAAHGY
ncbi:hypothetical protein [Ruegeria profundi]|nr:hypothetical protein [Ruegeria profundi]